MRSLRAFLHSHRQLAILLGALALAIKSLVPAGYMVGGNSGAAVLTVRICADAQAQSFTRQIVVPRTGGMADGAGGEHGKASGTCPFGALAMASLGGADALLLAAALGFILALGFAPLAPPILRRILHIRPPLRGPPALA